MLCVDFRLPNPKALRREFIEFIRKDGEGARGREGLEGEKSDMKGGGGRVSKRRLPGWAGGKWGGDAGGGPVSRLRGGECE